MQSFPLTSLTLNPTQLGRCTSHLSASDLPDIPGWTTVQSDQSDVSSDSSTRGRRQLVRQIFESESNLTFAEFEADKAQRQSNRYQLNIKRDPQNSHLASSLVSITDRVNSCLKSAETHRNQANSLRQSLPVARQHRFTRPPSPIHQSWNVGLPDQQHTGCAQQRLP